MEEKERKARREAEEQFSDEEDYCHAGSYPQETRTAITEDSYRGHAEDEPFPANNVSAKREDRRMRWAV